MYYGTGIFLIAVGAILAFAVNGRSVAGVNLPVVGWILMAAGLLAIIITAFNTRPRHSVTERTVERTGEPVREGGYEQPVVTDEGAQEHVVERRTIE